MYHIAHSKESVNSFTKGTRLHSVGNKGKKMKGTNTVIVDNNKRVKNVPHSKESVNSFTKGTRLQHSVGNKGKKMKGKKMKMKAPPPPPLGSTRRLW